MNIDRVQGLISWYPIKPRNAILTMAQFWTDQGVMAEDEKAAVIAGMDEIDRAGEPLDIRSAISERNDLRARNAVLEAERNEFVANGVRDGGTPAPMDKEEVL